MRSSILYFIIFTFWIIPGSISAKDDGVGFIQKLPWEEVNELLPKYSKFTVVDVDTGKRFQVQRRAGNRHADVQPLTVEDTKIMKEIFDDQWSWKRKAIIVIHENQWIAASMHGMPHGAGALKNNFPGHFCIHFYNSTTHRTNSMDFSHKLMVLKAAGELKEYLSSQKPIELINALIAGLKQKDTDILSNISLQRIDWDSYFHSVQNIKLNPIPKISKREDLSIEILVDVAWIDDQFNNKRFRGKVYLYRYSPLDSWKIDSKRFLKDIGIQNNNKQIDNVS